MLERIFPKQIDNTYRGHWLGLVLFAAVFGLKGVQGFMSMVNTRDTMVNADGFVLADFGAGLDTAVRMFALLGMYLFIQSVVSLIVVVRWRALVPFMFLVLLASQLGSRIIALLYAQPLSPAATMSFAGHAIGFWVNAGILALTTVGFALSLVSRGKIAAFAGSPH